VVRRVDGRLKVTGGARYSADVRLPGQVYAVLVDSTIASGRIVRLETAAAEAAPGVIGVITHLNAPPLEYPADAPQGGASTLRRVAVRAFLGDQIYFVGQHLAVVVADTLERARYAAALVELEYDSLPAKVELAEHVEDAFHPRRINGNRESDTVQGDPERALQQAEVVLDETYTTPIEHHNPMELSSCTAQWEDGRLTVYDTTQGVYDQRRALATTFGLPEENVRVVCAYLGGGFGCKFSVKPHTVLAAVAAQRVHRPVKLVLSRRQMFTSVGYRPANIQRLRLGASRDGHLQALLHTAVVGTAAHEEWVEHSAALSRSSYACEHRHTSHRAVRLNLDTPTIMRAPGEAPGSFALESAIDELAEKLGMDPIELRLRNFAETDPASGKPWSVNSLRECFQLGAERFGWSQRAARREGRELVGFGVAAAAREAVLLPATVRLRLFGSNLPLEVATAGHDIGTGTYTVLAQLVGAAFGLAADRIQVLLGDTRLPNAPAAGGSATATSVGSAAQLAVSEARRQLIDLAVSDSRSPLFDADPGSIAMHDGRLEADARRFDVLDELLERNGYGPGQPLEVNGHFQPPPPAERPFALHTFGAQFCEVRVDADLGILRVERLLGMFSCGRVLNPDTARSQLLGGMIGGLGMALLEETHVDSRGGRIVNASLADYLVPVHADIGSIEATWIDEFDQQASPIGAKGLGELPIIGVAAAVANAVSNATGVRVRELPITIEKVLHAGHIDSSRGLHLN
jgi:xanthine dehydrogenase YagR molybdenum-binding subunit